MQLTIMSPPSVGHHLQSQTENGEDFAGQVQYPDKNKPFYLGKSFTLERLTRAFDKTN
jgi:hypothetical protein